MDWDKIVKQVADSMTVMGLGKRAPYLHTWPMEEIEGIQSGYWTSIMSHTPLSISAGGFVYRLPAVPRG